MDVRSRLGRSRVKDAFEGLGVRVVQSPQASIVWSAVSAFAVAYPAVTALQQFTLNPALGLLILGTCTSIVRTLRQTRDVRSRLGLFIAFIVQTLLTGAASATLTHSLSFIFMVSSSERMLRLVNALAYTKPEQPAMVRIETALGKVSLHSLKSVGLNLAALICIGVLTTRPVLPTIVALVIDFCLHVTYFVAVLSIDVRRLELEDLMNEDDDEEEEEDEDEQSYLPTLISAAITIIATFVIVPVNITFSIRLPVHIAVVLVTAASTAASVDHFVKDARDENVASGAKTVFLTKDLVGHSLDIVRLATSLTGIVASVALDHKVLLWQVNAKRQQPTKVPLPDTAWPVTAIELDADGRFVAICTRSDVYCWSIATSRFAWSVPLPGLVPMTILFQTEKVPGMVTRVNLVIIGNDGVLYQIATDNSVVFKHKICSSIVAAEKLFTPRLPKRIVSCARDGTMYITMLVRTTWITHTLDLRRSLITQLQQPTPNEAISLVALPQLGMVLRARGVSIDLIDVQSGTIVKQFQIAPYRHSSLRVFHDVSKHCPFCGTSTISTLCIVYCEKDTDMLIMHSFVNPNRARKNICLRVERDPREKRCVGFEGVTEQQHWVKDLTAWEITDINVIMGLRRRDLQGRDDWEGCTMSMDGTVSTYRLQPTDNFDSHTLLVSQPRAVAKLGHRSTVVGFGNTLRVIYLGKSEIISPVENEGQAYASRRRRGRRSSSVPSRS